MLAACSLCGVFIFISVICFNIYYLFAVLCIYVCVANLKTVLSINFIKSLKYISVTVHLLPKQATRSVRIIFQQIYQ